VENKTELLWRFGDCEKDYLGRKWNGGGVGGIIEYQWF
jgi:hypothetical protein